MAEADRNGAGDSLATAIGQYVLGEISLGKAAENAGMTRWKFEEPIEGARFDALYGCTDCVPGRQTQHFRS